MLVKTKVAAAPAYAVLPAHDIQRARDFWERVMGLEVEDTPVRGNFFLNAGMGTKIMVYETAATHGDATQASFMVDDLDDVMQELRARGVTFEEYDMPGLRTVDGVADMGEFGRSAWFKDSEGNTLSIGEH